MEDTNKVIIPEEAQTLLDRADVSEFLRSMSKRLFDKIKSGEFDAANEEHSKLLQLALRYYMSKDEVVLNDKGKKVGPVERLREHVIPASIASPEGKFLSETEYRWLEGALAGTMRAFGLITGANKGAGTSWHDRTRAEAAEHATKAMEHSDALSSLERTLSSLLEALQTNDDKELDGLDTSKLVSTVNEVLGTKLNKPTIAPKPSSATKVSAQELEALGSKAPSMSLDKEDIAALKSESGLLPTDLELLKGDKHGLVRSTAHGLLTRNTPELPSQHDLSKKLRAALRPQQETKTAGDLKVQNDLLQGLLKSVGDEKELKSRVEDLLTHAISDYFANLTREEIKSGDTADLDFFRKLGWVSGDTKDIRNTRLKMMETSKTFRKGDRNIPDRFTKGRDLVRDFALEVHEAPIRAFLARLVDDASGQIKEAVGALSSSTHGTDLEKVQEALKSVSSASLVNLSEELKKELALAHQGLGDITKAEVEHSALAKLPKHLSDYVEGVLFTALISEASAILGQGKGSVSERHRDALKKQLEERLRIISQTLDIKKDIKLGKGDIPALQDKLNALTKKGDTLPTVESLRDSLALLGDPQAPKEQLLGDFAKKDLADGKQWYGEEDKSEQEKKEKATAIEKKWKTVNLQKVLHKISSFSDLVDATPDFYEQLASALNKVKMSGHAGNKEHAQAIIKGLLGDKEGLHWGFLNNHPFVKEVEGILSGHHNLHERNKYSQFLDLAESAKAAIKKLEDGRDFHQGVSRLKSQDANDILEPRRRNEKGEVMDGHVPADSFGIIDRSVLKSTGEHKDPTEQSYTFKSHSMQDSLLSAAGMLRNLFKKSEGHEVLETKEIARNFSLLRQFWEGLSQLTRSLRSYAEEAEEAVSSLPRGKERTNPLDLPVVSKKLDALRAYWANKFRGSIRSAVAELGASYPAVAKAERGGLVGDLEDAVLESWYETINKGPEEASNGTGAAITRAIERHPSIKALSAADRDTISSAIATAMDKAGGKQGFQTAFLRQVDDLSTLVEKERIPYSSKAFDGLHDALLSGKAPVEKKTEVPVFEDVDKANTLEGIFNRLKNNEFFVTILTNWSNILGAPVFPGKPSFYLDGRPRATSTTKEAAEAKSGTELAEVSRRAYDNAVSNLFSDKGKGNPVYDLAMAVNAHGGTYNDFTQELAGSGITKEDFENFFRYTRQLAKLDKPFMEHNAKLGNIPKLFIKSLIDGTPASRSKEASIQALRKIAHVLGVSTND